MSKIFSLVFTGISGSGKTTLAKRVAEKLDNLGVYAEFIDGDEFRNEIGNLFGYTREERMKNNRVVRTVMKYLAKNNINVIFTLVAPYEEMRKAMRESLKPTYIEVYVKCSANICAKRDVKGYYKKQKEGLLENLNGIDDAYEIPQNSEIVVDTESDSVEKCAGQIVDYLRANDYIDYKYITENNLENRQDYMYSKYGGDDFLKAYFLTREKFISKNIRGESFKISREEEGGETNVGLIALLKELKSGNWTEKIKHELDFFVKAFEVRKKIYDDYEIGTVRPALDSGYARIENYILLSGCAYYGYSISGILKYLNAMLKLDDTLLSISDRMNDEEKNNLAILLKLETKLIKIERERR